MEPYTFRSVPSAQASKFAGQLLAQPEPTAILAIDTTATEAEQHLARVDHIFTDADGTLVSEGAEMIDQQVAALVKELAEKGIGTTVVTGKPLAEVEPILKAAPALEFICEKGAYTVRQGPLGIQKEYLLSSAALEHEIQQFRAKFELYLGTLAKKYNVGFGWAGSGAHTSMISVDVFAAAPPENYLQLRGPERDALKLHDINLQRQVESEVVAWLQTEKPSWRIVNLGNGNTEIAPPGIEKSHAIEASPAFKTARAVLIMGDSKNDEAMFNVKSTRPDKVINGLVLHRKAGLLLLPHADFVTFGMANCAPLLAATLATHYA